MNIIPIPKKIQEITETSSKISFTCKIMPSSTFGIAIQTFASYIETLYHVEIEIHEDADISVEQHDDMDSEGYRILINEEKVLISAKDCMGAHHAFATLLQIMEVQGERIFLPIIEIEDQPDCKYRGLMVDLARNWHPFDYLLNYVDMCYFYKVAVLHLHFTDDQSYTLPSECYPRLSTTGRSYSKEQITELIEYAHERGIELIPEIDVPGHCKSFGEAYGELFGTKGVICQHTESMNAMQQIFGELCDLFVYSKYIHIGGDEAYTMEEWTKCEKCCEYAKREGIDSDMEDRTRLAELMYAHFITKMADVCFKKGKQPIVWEGFPKAVNDKISKDILVMSWENYYQLTPDLLEAGFQIVNCSWNPMYIVTPNTMWTLEEIYDWSVYKWKAVHQYSPYLNVGYEANIDANICGGQLLAWGDNIANQCPSVEVGVLEEQFRILERVPMLAENTWNVEHMRQYEDFEKDVKQLARKIKNIFRTIE